ncbi:MAG: gliding motility-associated C-terminal domain-containing protein [Chitinophagales bacterium]
MDTIRPVANATADKTITCANPSYVIGAAAVAGNTYSWSPAAGLDNPAIAQPTVSASGTFTLTVTNTTNGCTSSDAVTIAVDTIRPVANAGADKIITCANPTFTIGAAAVAGNTYSWSPAGGLSNPAIAQPTVSQPNTYTLTVTNTINSCINTDAVVITRDTTSPSVDAGPDKIITCTNPTFVIGTAAIAGQTYSWAPAPGLSNPNIAQPTASTTGTFTVTATKTANGCTKSDAVTITVDTIRPVANATADKTITCANPSYVIGAAAVAGNTYSWSPATGLDNPAIAQPTVSASGTFTLTVTNTTNGCTSSDAVIIAVDTIRPVANAGADKIITCANPTFVIGSAAVAGNTYSWSPAAGLSNPAIAQPTVSSTGTYTLTVTKTINGCTASDIVNVTVDTTRPAVNAGADQTLTCTNTSFVIGTAATAGNAYSWSPAAGLSNPAIAQPTVTTTGTFTVTVTKSVNGCSASDDVTITVDTIRPGANAGADKLITCNDPTHLIGTVAIAGNTYSWSPAAGLDNPAIAQPTASTTGTYTLTVTKTVNGCTSVDAMTVSVDTSKPVTNAGADKLITCANPTHVIGTAAVAGQTYAWSPPAGLSNPAIAQPTVSTTGTFTVTVTKTANGCTKSDDVVIAVDTSRPVANAGPDKIITCANPTHVIGTGAIAGNTYAWTPAAGLSDPAIARPTASTTGTFTVTVTKTANGCTASDAVLVSVDTSRPAAIAGPDKIITCANPTHVIGDPAIAGNTYAWTPAAGLSNPAIAQPTVSSTGTFTLTVTQTSNGCTKSDEVVITVDTVRPIANAGADKIITCSNPTHVIGTAAIAGNTYAWSPALGLSNPAIAQPTASTTGTFTVTVTRTVNGCTAADAVLVSVDTSRPVANAGPDKINTCANPTHIIGTATIAGNTYAWSPALGLDNPAIAQPTASTTGTYTLTVTKSINGCTSVDAMVVSVDTSRPVVDAGTDKIITCANPTHIIGTAAIAGQSYAWAPAAGLNNPAIAQPTASTTGTYTLTVTKSINGCTAVDAMIVSVDTSRPVANAGVDKIITCTHPTHVIGSAAIAGNTYAWSPALGLDNPAIAQPTASTTGTYTLTVTKSINGCTAVDAMVVSVDTSRPVANAGVNKIITCANPTHVIGTAAIAGNTYAWSPAAGLSNPAIAQPSVSATGTFTLTVTQTANGCTKSDEVVVSVDTIHPAANAGPDKIITCDNPTHVIGSAAIAGNTYAWTPAAGLDNPAAAQPTASTTGTYTVTVTKTVNGCTNSDAVKIAVDTSRPAVNAGADKIITCSNPTHVIGSPAIAGNTYSWAPAAGLSNPAIAQPTASSIGTFTLTVTKSINGCTAADVVLVDVDTTKPVTDAGIDKTLTCVVKSVSIGTTAVAGNTYQWSPAAGLNNTAAAQPVANAVGTYSIVVTKTANGCKDSDRVNVTIDTITPLADAGPDQTLICININTTQSVTLGIAPIANMSYAWTPADLVSDNTAAQPSTNTSGTYAVTVTNDINGCKAHDTTVIDSEDCFCDFYVPSAFSPNNDGVNDLFFAFINCDKFNDFSFSIFNRWGELVFKTNDITLGWDGIFKGEPQQVDSYEWVVEYFDVLRNKRIFKKGIVTLLR